MFWGFIIGALLAVNGGGETMTRGDDVPSTVKCKPIEVGGRYTCDEQNCKCQNDGVCVEEWNDKVQNGLGKYCRCPKGTMGYHCETIVESERPIYPLGATPTRAKWMGHHWEYLFSGPMKKCEFGPQTREMVRSGIYNGVRYLEVYNITKQLCAVFIQTGENQQPIPCSDLKWRNEKTQCPEIILPTSVITDMGMIRDQFDAILRMFASHSPNHVNGCLWYGPIDSKLSRASSPSYSYLLTGCNNQSDLRSEFK